MAAERSAVLLDWGGVMTSNLFGSFAAFCADEGLDRDVAGQPLPPRPRRPHAADRLRVRARRGGRLRATPGDRAGPGLARRPDRPPLRRRRAGPGDGRRRARAARARRVHRPGLELLGHAALPARAPRRAVRRRGHLRRGGLPQARPAHVRARRAAHRRRAERVRLRRRPRLQPGPRARAGDGGRPSHGGGEHAGRARAAGRARRPPGVRCTARRKQHHRGKAAAAAPGRAARAEAWSIGVPCEH